MPRREVRNDLFCVGETVEAGTVMLAQHCWLHCALCVNLAASTAERDTGIR